MRATASNIVIFLVRYLVRFVRHECVTPCRIDVPFGRQTTQNSKLFVPKTGLHYSAIDEMVKVYCCAAGGVLLRGFSDATEAEARREEDWDGFQNTSRFREVR